MRLGGRLIERKHELDHPLHLALVRPAVSAHGLLDPRGGVLGALELRERGRDEHGAAGLPDEERGAGVGTHERLLERDGVGRMCRNEIANPDEDRSQAPFRALASGGPPHPLLERSDPPVACVDDPEPACSRPRVDAEYLHDGRVRGRSDITRMGAEPLATVARALLQPTKGSVMPSFRSRRPSPAMIVACLALAISLGGTAVAAVTAALPRNSVGTLQLKNNAVTSAKVKNGSLAAADFASGALRPGPAGPQGPAGPGGPQGAKGDKGDAGGVGDLIEHSASVSVPGGIAENAKWETRSVQANCSSGEKGITGGTNWTGEGDQTELATVLSTPVFDSGGKKITGWRGRGANDTAVAHDFQVYVYCVKA
jgi:hypothetical protein